MYKSFSYAYVLVSYSNFDPIVFILILVLTFFCQYLLSLVIR